MKTFLVPILIILSFAVITILPNSLNACLPGGCSFANQVCDKSSCVGETLTQHLNERAQFLNITTEPQSFIILVIVLAFFLLVRKFLEDRKAAIARAYFKHKLLNSSRTNLFNYLIEAFSSGILYPKVY